MDNGIGRVKYFVGVLVTLIGGTLGLFIIGIICNVVLKIIDIVTNSNNSSIFDDVFPYIGLVILAIVIIINILLARLRCTNLKINKNFSLLLLVPFVNFLFTLFLIFAPGKLSDDEDIKEVNDETINKIENSSEKVINEPLDLKDVFKAAPNVDDFINKQK